MPQKNLLVVKLSGTLFFSNKFEPFVAAIKHLLSSSKSLSLVLVAGGGVGAREYIRVARDLGADAASQDEIGIEVSRLNARVLAVALEKLAYPMIPTRLSEIVEAIEVEDSRLVILGGFHPGQSTNAVGALIAEKLRAKHFINLTDVEGVYSKDPNKSKDAKKLDSVTVSKLASILRSESMNAGGYDLMDIVALKLIERSHVPTTIMHCDPQAFERAILHKDSKLGTAIISDSLEESQQNQIAISSRKY
ncbi:MAG: UMP kinase [Nitrososphaerales archaeon]